MSQKPKDFTTVLLERVDDLVNREEMMVEIGYRIGLIGVKTSTDVCNFVRICAIIYEKVKEHPCPYVSLDYLITQEYVEGLIDGYSSVVVW